jgi:integrase
MPKSVSEARETEKIPVTAHLRLVAPRNKNRTVPIRPTNSQLRAREYLTADEVDKLMKVARDGRYGRRDSTLILTAYRHGLRASEICDLEWSQLLCLGRTDRLKVRSRVSSSCGAKCTAVAISTCFRRD